MAGTLFAIKDAIDLKLTKASESTVYTVIDYLNDVQIQMDSEQVYALKKGENYISFSSGRTGTLTMNCQVMDDDFLCMMLGGTKGSDGTIKVTGSIPNQSYKGEGTFRTTSINGDAYKKITFYNLKAQVSADLTLSATDVSEFSLVLDILADDAGNIMDIAPVSNPSTSAINEPEVIQIKADK